MPELPEVKTIQNQLSAYLPFKIQKVSTTPELFQNVAHTPLHLVGLTLLEIKRKGKLLDFVFDDGSHLLSHLGMTGTWLIGERLKIGKHSHLILQGEKLTLIYDDPRRFGHLYHYSQAQAQQKLSELGMDLADPMLDLNYLTASLKRYPQRPLKVTLLDQKLFAGSGNYIANEICARAGIMPTRLCADIKKNEFIKIHQAISQVLNPAISAGGTTFQGGYRDTQGDKGKGVTHLVVFYQETCQMCMTGEVRKIMLNGRGTYFCEVCQK